MRSPVFHFIPVHVPGHFQCPAEDANARNTRVPASDLFVLTFDPIPEVEGGFRPGAEFNSTDLCFSLQLKAFAPGTILQHAHHAYTVTDAYRLRRDDLTIFIANYGKLEKLHG
jgi:hypothetical protein